MKSKFCSDDLLLNSRSSTGVITSALGYKKNYGNFWDTGTKPLKFKSKMHSR